MFGIFIEKWSLETDSAKMAKTQSLMIQSEWTSGQIYFKVSQQKREVSFKEYWRSRRDSWSAYLLKSIVQKYQKVNLFRKKPPNGFNSNLLPFAGGSAKSYSKKAKKVSFLQYPSEIPRIINFITWQTIKQLPIARQWVIINNKLLFLMLAFVKRSSTWSAYK